jgi:putative heme-binding domain-containing protein
MKRIRFLLLLIIVLLPFAKAWGQTLDAELKRESSAELAAAARELGDPTRGAIVFHQPSLACSKCHVVNSEAASALGPNLATLGGDVTDEGLVDSVLYPSKAITPGYESMSVLTIDGRMISALLAEQTPDQVVLRDVARDGELLTIPTDDIDEIKQNELSIMPAGQMNQLGSRQQFLDLIRYLMEIRDGGPQRAQQLQPSPALLTFAIPEYENHLDHRGLIGTWNVDSFRRGEAIYQRTCANCHGTHDQPGSLPTSLRFADGQFKNGSDPLAMYRTLTHGFGQMTAQTWMVPSQKYDVIHYIREAYLKTHNSAAYTVADESYLAKLPVGDTFGPEPSNIEVWSAMDYGPSLIHTFEIPGSSHNFAYKGIAIRLNPGAGGVSRGGHWMVFDTDTLRIAAGWHSGGESSSQNNFIDWRAIQFNGEHGVHPTIVGEVAFANPTGPGWGWPQDGSFQDNQRVEGRDGRQYGPLPKNWGQFRGIFHHDQQVILSYSIGDVEILESPRFLVRDTGTPVMLRTFNIGPRDQDLVLQVAHHSTGNAELSYLSKSNRASVIVNRPGDEGDKKEQAGTAEASEHSTVTAGFAPENLPAEWFVEDGNLRLRLRAGTEPLKFSVWLPTSSSGLQATSAISETLSPAPDIPAIPDAALDLQPLTMGGPPRWPQTMTTQVQTGIANGPFAVDVLTEPETNPWLALTRFTGLDFFDDGRIAVCSWDGDVWIASPRRENDQELLDWQRIASGLFQPLGLKIVNGKIHLTCRDQLVVLHDLNGNGEIDFYQCLNNDHQVTEHFHEFAMGLQIDDDGNFYYAKSGCHGKAAVVPHHGTLLKVSADGARTEILANGFRAANGVCLNPDGSFVVTDQEGFWNPKNRINWVTLSDSGSPNFYGNMLGYHDVSDAADEAMVQPLCWITNDFDRSPAELLWVDSPAWGSLHGSLLNLSYGYGKVYLVPHEQVNGQMQGGMIELPLPIFPTGVMRGRFHPADGQLYLCGMFAWAGSATHPGGMYRVRHTGEPSGMPIELKAFTWGIEMRFAEELDLDSVAALENYGVEAWDLKRTARYGSDHINQRPWRVKSARLQGDGKVVHLEIPDIAPTWGMEIVYRLRSAAGRPIIGKIHNTIHNLRATTE